MMLQGLNKTTGKVLLYRLYPVEIELKGEFLGTEYGGWFVNLEGISKSSIVYSLGVGEDISFDLTLIEKTGARVYAFDPTPRSIRWVKSQQLPDEFKLYEYGIAGYDGVARFKPPANPDHVSHTILDKPETTDKAIEVEVHRLKTIMKELGHDKIELLKMDIEGAEYEVLDDLVSSHLDVKQILVEFHHRWDNVGYWKTLKTIRKLRGVGYRVFHISKSGDEYSLIKPNR